MKHKRIDKFYISPWPEFISRLEMILGHIKKYGRTTECPYWPCAECKKQFPSVTENRCPCMIYTKRYLIKRLNQIIKQAKKQQAEG